jgi:hypothetical protein
MSGDLAKLKEQLSKIMNQADKYEKKSISNPQSSAYTNVQGSN